MSNVKPNQQPLVFRVGITGKRVIADIAAVEAGLDRLFGLIAAKARALAADRPTPRLVLITPLAEGADRLAAEAALVHGFDLEVALPFPQADYERDFPATVEAFRALLAQAGRVVTLDGVRHNELDADQPDRPLKGSPAEMAARDQRRQGYEAVGRGVVNGADLMAAVWDRQPAAGRGGTAEVVRYAASIGRPVWRIDPTGGAEPEWIADLGDYDRPSESNAPASLDQRLDTILCRTWNRRR